MWDSRKRRADTQLTPTKSQYKSSPPSSQESPLLMARHRRTAAPEPQTPTRRKARPAFPNFVNSFAPQQRESRESTPESDPAPEPDPAPNTPPEAPAALATAHSGALFLFRRRVRWATLVMCYPLTREEPPAQVRGSPHFPIGGVREWKDVAVRLDGSSLLVALGQLDIPAMPAALAARLSDALSVVWHVVLQGNSFYALTSAVHGDLDAIGAPEANNLWHAQSSVLFGAVSAALRTAAGIFLRMGLVRRC